MTARSTTGLIVRDVMTSPAVVLGLDATYSEIVHLFLSSDIGGMPVVDAAGRLVGVVTRDFRVLSCR